MKKWTCLALAAMFSGAVYGGANLIPGGDAESKAWPLTKQSPEAAKNGQNGFLIDGKSKWVYSPDYVPVAKGKKYRLSFWGRSVNGPSNCFIGLALYNEKNQPVMRNAVAAVPQTMTALAAPAKAGDTEIRIADGAAWGKVYRQTPMAVAFGAKEDLGDLPNMNLSPRIKTVAQRDGAWFAVLASPLRKDYPEGTPVRLHKEAMGHCYSIMIGSMTPEWKYYSVEVENNGKDGNNYINLWPGTAKVRFVLVANYNQDKAGVYFDDVVLEEL